MSAQTDDRDSYTAQRPSKSDFFLARLNVGSPDHGCPIGGSAHNRISSGEIAAAISLKPPALPGVERYVDRKTALWMLDRLLWFKYSNEADAGVQLYYLLLCDVFTRQLIEEKIPAKKLLEEIRENRPALQNCSALVIDDICRPALYRSMSGREWAKIIGLTNHNAWRRTWSNRYSKLRSVVQDLDSAIIGQIERRV